VNDVVIPVTHAEEHVDVHTNIGRERAMGVDQGGPLRTCRIEAGGKRRKPRHEQDGARV
jgi:hypothetical protein